MTDQPSLFADPPPARARKPTGPKPDYPGDTSGASFDYWWALPSWSPRKAEK